MNIYLVDTLEPFHSRKDNNASIQLIIDQFSLLVLNRNQIQFHP